MFVELAHFCLQKKNCQLECRHQDITLLFIIRTDVVYVVGLPTAWNSVSKAFEVSIFSMNKKYINIYLRVRVLWSLTWSSWIASKLSALHTPLNALLSEHSSLMHYKPLDCCGQTCLFY